MILGIDPGFTGAIAAIDKGILNIEDLPIKYIMNKKQIDENKFDKLIRKWTEHSYYKSVLKFAVIEDVHSMPNQGVASTFSFGYNAGILLGVLAAHNIKVLKVRPNVWKPALGLDRDKKKSLVLARKVFPKYESYFRLMKHDGRAEAALIAHFAQKSL